jgi:alpha-galactosidase
MKEFADEVRASGLKFGLWMEPERYGPLVPVRQKHPDWFVSVAHGMSRINLENKRAYAWLRGEIGRLIETYDVRWLKVDFNFRLGHDASGAALSRYYEAWYRLSEEVRKLHPKTFIEGCASGGMRLDLECLAHCDGHFLSDTVNPIHEVRITHGALLRLPPGLLTRWAVLRSVGKTIPQYGFSVAEWQPTLVAPGGSPGGAVWEPSETVNLDFAVLAAMPGMFGLSGDLDGLPQETRGALKGWVAFFKEWRGFIHNSVGHLLTPERPRDDRSGWAALQLQEMAGGKSLVFVYRLDDMANRQFIRLRGLVPAASYVVEKRMPAEGAKQIVSGAELMADGLQVEIAARMSAAVYSIEAKR